MARIIFIVFAGLSLLGCATKAERDTGKEKKKLISLESKSDASGYVKVLLTVGKNGDVIDIRILESSPPGVFENTVIKTVQQYRFDGTGSTYLIEQEFAFKLKD